MSIVCHNKINYITLPDGTMIKLFSIDNEGVPIFNHKFLCLWALLDDLGKANPPSFVGTITDFILPTDSKSVLVGTPYLTDPTSLVRVYSFKNNKFSGPVTNDGFSLDMFSEDLFYKISWSIRENSNNVKIGFYKSNGFTYNTVNTLALICGDKGPALFSESTGSFTFEGISQLYVASDADVTIDMEVSVVIPKERISPLVTEDKPYVEYITVCNKCRKWRLPVYKIKSVKEANRRMEDKQATSMFKQAAKVITEYLMRTALSIELFDDDKEAKLQLMQNEIKRYTTVDTRVYSTSITSFMTVGMNTNNIGPDKTDEFARVHQGIKLERPENISNNTVPRISFKITTGQISSNLGSVFASVVVSYYTSWRWPTHSRLDNQGNVVGGAVYPENGSLLTVNIGDTIEHSFILKGDATDFSVTVYYDELSSNEMRQYLADNTKFQLITVEWITLPRT